MSSFGHPLRDHENVGPLNQGPIGEEVVARVSFVGLSAVTLPLVRFSVHVDLVLSPEELENIVGSDLVFSSLFLAGRFDTQVLLLLEQLGTSIKVLLDGWNRRGGICFEVNNKNLDCIAIVHIDGHCFRDMRRS